MLCAQRGREAKFAHAVRASPLSSKKATSTDRADARCAAVANSVAPTTNPSTLQPITINQARSFYLAPFSHESPFFPRKKEGRRNKTARILSSPLIHTRVIIWGQACKSNIVTAVRQHAGGKSATLHNGIRSPRYDETDNHGIERRGRYLRNQHQHQHQPHPHPSPTCCLTTKVLFPSARWARRVLIQVHRHGFRAAGPLVPPASASSPASATSASHVGNPGTLVLPVAAAASAALVVAQGGPSRRDTEGAGAETVLDGARKRRGLRWGWVVPVQ